METTRRAGHVLLLAAAGAVLPPGCCDPPPAAPLPEAGELFASGFEPETTAIPGDAEAGDLVGRDASTSLGDWQRDLESPPLGSFSIQYQGGTPEQRWMALEPDPVDPANTVLAFHLAAANVPAEDGGPKARIQANLYGNEGLAALTSRIRLWPGEGFAALQASGETFTWLTLAEFWNDADWKEGEPFRITLSAVKEDPTPGAPLLLEIRGQEKTGSGWETLWSATDPEPLEPETWTVIELRLQEGGPEDGRLVLRRGPDADALREAVNLTGATRHPDLCDPDGYSEINPFKLYTSAELVEGLQAAGTGLEVLWDDWRLWQGWPEEAVPTR